MIETAEKVAKALGAAQILPMPVGSAATALKVVAVACTVAGAILEELGDWDWPWSS